MDKTKSASYQSEGFGDKVLQCLMKSILGGICTIFRDDGRVKLAYLFGSRAGGDVGPLSDYDFAVFLEENNPVKVFEKKADLESKLSKFLGTDRVDIVILDTLKEPELGYNIITTGKVVFEKDPYRMIVEPKILNIYFDFHFLLSRHGLTAMA